MKGKRDVDARKIKWVFGEVSRGSLFNIWMVITNKVHSPITTTHAHLSNFAKN